MRALVPRQVLCLVNTSASNSSKGVSSSSKGGLRSHFISAWLFYQCCFSIGLIICFICSTMPGGWVHKKCIFFCCCWTLHIFEYSQSSCQIQSSLGLSREKKAFSTMSAVVACSTVHCKRNGITLLQNTEGGNLHLQLEIIPLGISISGSTK